jgi:hypothetical protein
MEHFEKIIPLIGFAIWIVFSIRGRKAPKRGTPARQAASPAKSYQPQKSAQPLPHYSSARPQANSQPNDEDLIRELYDSFGVPRRESADTGETNPDDSYESEIQQEINNKNTTNRENKPMQSTPIAVVDSSPLPQTPEHSSFTIDSLKTAVVWAEILDKPKCFKE